MKIKKYKSHKKIIKFLALSALFLQLGLQAITDTCSISSQYCSNTKTADLIIFSENNPKHLREVVASVVKYAPGIEKIYVLKDPCYGKYRDLYNSIKDKFNVIEFIKVAPVNFKSMLESILELDHNKYIIFSNGNIIFTKPINIDQCIKLLEKYNAESLSFLNPNKAQENLDILDQEQQNQENAQEQYQDQYDQGHGEEKNNFTIIENEIEDLPITQDNIFLWQIKQQEATDKPELKNIKNNIAQKNINMTLYRKDQISSDLKTLDYGCPKELVDNWNNACSKDSDENVFGKKNIKILSFTKTVAIKKE